MRRGRWWVVPTQADAHALECLEAGSLSPGGQGDVWDQDPERLPNPCLADSAEVLETCCVCLDSLSSDEVTPFLVSEGWDLQPASCRHYCHLHCAARLRPQRCPVCRVPFSQLRRVTREGVLQMTAGELCTAFRRMHGRPTVVVAVELLAAVFPIPTAIAAQRFKQLARLDHAEAALTEEGLAKVLRHLAVHSPELKFRAPPLSYYAGVPNGQGMHDLATVMQRRLRRLALRLCSAAGGACHGLLVGLLVGTAGGMVVKQRPGPPQKDQPEAACMIGSRISWLDLLGHCLDTLAPWHVFGSAFIAALMAISIGCLSVLLVRVLFAAGTAAGRVGRMVHRALWVWMAHSLGKGAGEEAVSANLLAFCMVGGALVGALCGSTHALAVVDLSQASHRVAGAFWQAALGSFSCGVRAGGHTWVGWRRRRAVEAERLGDGSLRITAAWARPAVRL